ncbi:MAG: VOC family protein [Myxococcales bacterium]|nr:VOC family protein [Myxococcales bacterium]
MAITVENPVGTPCWFDLTTDDISTACSFYKAIFGWDYDVSNNKEVGHYSIAKVQGRSAAGLGQRPSTGHYPKGWMVYLAVDDIHISCDNATQRGAKIEHGLLERPGTGYMATLQDTTGASYGIWQPNGHKGFQIKGEHGSFAWCEIYSRNHNKTRDFYSELLGLDHRPLENLNMTYTIMSKGFPAFGVMQMGDEFGEMAPHWMCYFAVNNTDATAEIIKNHGGTVAHGPFDSPLGRMAVCSDPNDAWFSIVVPQRT